MQVGHYAMGGEAPVPVVQHPQKVGNLLGCEDTDDNCEQWAANGESEIRRGAFA
jgi:hypothetical protein